MRNTIVSLALAAFAFPVLAASSVKATVNGMVCAFCAQGIEKTISKMDATKAAELGFQWQGLLGKSGDRFGLVSGTNFGTAGNNIINMSVANPAYLKLMQVQPNASSFAEIIRHCALVKAGPRIDNPDLEAWLRLADTLRRVQAQRSFVMHTVDGQHFQVYETSFSDGWLLNIMHPLVVDAAPEAT